MEQPQPVSPKLVTARMQALGILMVVGAIPVILIFVKAPLIVAAGAALIWLALGGWRAWLIPRQVRAISYECRESDLIVRRGIMFRHEDLVPYGRMQYVVVESGPITGRLGLASVTMHTASETSIEIPGLLKADAETLRDELAALGESHLAGL